MSFGEVKYAILLGVELQVEWLHGRWFVCSALVTIPTQQTAPQCLYQLTQPPAVTEHSGRSTFLSTIGIVNFFFHFIYSAIYNSVLL